MRDGREHSEYLRQSCLLALIANCHRDEKKRRRPFVPSDFYRRSGDPEHRVAAGRLLTGDELRAMKQAGLWQ